MTSPHPFEAAGLGKAPFQFVSLEHRSYQACPGAPVQVGGSCDFCGTGICYFCWVLSSDGRRFKVGSDCVRKTDPAVYAEIKRAERDERAAARRAAREEEAERLRTSRATQFQGFVLQVPGLPEAFAVGAAAGDATLADLHARGVRYGSLSEKQVAFALGLAERIRNPRPAEVHVPAPTGRVEVEGEVVAVKAVEDHFRRSYNGQTAVTYKMVVKVQTPAGSWLCWSSIPAQIAGVQKGERVRFTASLERGRDEHFAFGKRPSKAEVLR